MNRNDAANMASSSSDETTTAQLLPMDFSPGPNHVVCHRGRIFWDHEGNKKYRSTIKSATHKYAACKNKYEKSLVVSEIVEAIIHNKNVCKGGGFVKMDAITGRWVEADEIFSREKVGQSLRDSLHAQYRSSTKAKKRRKTVLFDPANEVVEQVIHSNQQVSDRIHQLSNDVQSHGDKTSEQAISALFNQANRDILETIKLDPQLRHRFQQVTNRCTCTVAPELTQRESKQVIQAPCGAKREEPASDSTRQRESKHEVRVQRGTKRKESAGSTTHKETQIVSEKRIRFDERKCEDIT
jgi:hypothetical protein